MEGGKGESEVPEGVVVGKVRALVAEVGNQPIERAVGKAAYALGGDDVNIDGVGAEGEGGGVPDGIEDDIMDGVEWTVAVPANKETARECGPELGSGQPGDGVDVVAADDTQKERPHIASIPCPPPQIRLLLSHLLLPIRKRDYALGSAVIGGGTGRLGR
jgi:hypothetical protein